MFEKVNPCHPDKVADRIAGAIVDLAYKKELNPKVAVEVLIGHGYAYIIVESSVEFTHIDVLPIVHRICGQGVIKAVRLLSVPQDKHLSENQVQSVRCGDNGIFKGVPVSSEERLLTKTAVDLFNKFPSDGKFVINNYKATPHDLGAVGNIFANIIICQSCAKTSKINEWLELYQEKLTQFYQQKVELKSFINPLGDWTGGLDVDNGATNRKLGSDMGRGVTGGGLHGKDLSKADVSINIACHLQAQEIGLPVVASCAIGDEIVEFQVEGTSDVIKQKYTTVVESARRYITELGGFEKFAEWGLIR